MIQKETSPVVAMVQAKTVEGEDQLFKALSIMDQMVVGLKEGLPMVVVKSLSLDSSNKSHC